VGAIAVYVELPAMVNAAKAILLIPSKKHGSAAMRAESIHATYVSIGVPIGYKVFA